MIAVVLTASIFFSLLFPSFALVPVKKDTVVEGTELLFAFVMHRHGERTPLKQSLTLVGDEDLGKIDELIEPWGYGELTDAGKRTGFMIGVFIRNRYDELLSDKYKRSEIYIRSTDSTRTKMTVLAAMSAVYPVTKDPWNKLLFWEPVPYTTVPARLDYNLPSINCPVYKAYLSDIFGAPHERLRLYRNATIQISEIVGRNLSETPVLFSQVNDLFDSLTKLGYKLDDRILGWMPRIRDMASIAWDIMAGNEEYLPLVAGVVLQEFFKHARDVVNGIPTPKVRVYSAHDINVYAFEAITKVTPKQGAPKYGCIYSLELRKVTATGEFVILPVYVHDPHRNLVKYLQVQGCGDSFLCNLDSFQFITSPFALDENTWRNQCDYSPDLEIDTSLID